MTSQPQEKPRTRRMKEAAKRELTAERMVEQLEVWSTRLDGLVAGFLHAGAQAHDPYRLRVEALRLHHRAAQRTLNDYLQASPSGQRGTWGAFQKAIKEDWAALEDGLEQATR